MSLRKPPPPPTEGLMDLFAGQQLPPAPVERPDPLWGALDVTWPKVPAGRHLCQDCVALIHGREGGAHPRAAVARRKGPVSDLLLCHEHAQQHRDEDAKVQREHAGKVTAAKAARKAAKDARGYGPRREHA